MDLETKMVIVSRNVVFDEISSYRDDADNNKSTTTVALFPDDSTLGRKEFTIGTDIQASTEKPLQILQLPKEKFLKYRKSYKVICLILLLT